MEIILEPVVHVMSIPKFIEHPVHKIPDDGNDLVKIGAFAAKSCYDSFGVEGRSNEENQRRIQEAADGSVLEHLNIGLFVEGISRALSLESNRHRFLHPSQRSTRYTKEDEASIILEPYYSQLWNKFKDSMSSDDNDSSRIKITIDDADKQSLLEADILLKFIGSCRESLVIYQYQVENLIKLNPLNLTGFDLRKWARGKARNILPHALETKIFYTGSIRAWRWVIQVRSAKNAEPEIRRLACLIYDKLKEVAPLYFEDFDDTETYDGIRIIKPKFSKI